MPKSRELVGRLVNVRKLCVAERCVRGLRADLDHFMGDNFRLDRIFLDPLVVNAAVLLVSKDKVPLLVLLCRIVFLC